MPSEKPYQRKFFPFNSQWALLSILLIVFLVYVPSLRGQFLNWDDDLHLTKNDSIRSLSLNNLKEIASSTVNKIYIPLTVLSFAIEYHFAGLNPFIYHLDNLLLYLAVVGLIVLFAIQCGLNESAALLGALFFGLHPIHVESVAWVTERKDVLYALFYLLALNAYLVYIRKNKIRFLCLSLITGVLSILSKPMALSLPFILFLCDWFLQRRWTPQVVFEKIPFVLTMAPIAFATYAFNARIPGGHNNSGESILTWFWTFSFYLQKFVWPWQLIPLYDLPQPVRLTNIEYLWAVMVTAIFVALMIYAMRKRLMMVIFAGLFYFGSIFFLLRFDNLKDTNIVADRFMYLPSLGFCLLGGWLADEWLQKTKERLGPRVVLCLLMILLGGKTIMQTQIWHDSLSLWNYVITLKPKIVLAYNSRGTVLLEEGKVASALQDFNHAIAIRPDYAKAYYNRATLFGRQGQDDLAVADFTNAIKIDNTYASAYSGRGLVYSKHNQYDLALADLNKTLLIDAKRYKDYNNRAIVHELRGEYDLSLKDYGKALELFPGFSEALFNRARVYRLTGQNELALKDLTDALTLKPHWTEAYRQRAEILGQQKQKQ